MIFGQYDMKSVPHDLKRPEDFAGLYGLNRLRKKVE
jgi:hypothetical protein